MDADRRATVWPIVGWAMGSLVILGALIPLATNNLRGAAIGVPVGLTAIAAATALHKGLLEGAVGLTSIEVEGRHIDAWIIRPATSVVVSEAVFYGFAATAYLILLILARHVLWRLLGAVGFVMFLPLLVRTLSNVRSGGAAAIALTRDGILATRSKRHAFAPWSAVSDVRAASSLPQRATTIHLRFSDPTIARSMRDLSRWPVIRARAEEWHLYLLLLGTGVEGQRLADTVLRCAHDPEARTHVGTERGLVALGLVDAGASGKG